MSKAILSADELIAGIVGDELEHEISGVGVVRIRGLTFAEVASLQRKYGDDNEAMMVDAVAMALVKPKLSEEQVAKLQGARAGYVLNLWQKISALSGMNEALEGELGGGS